MTPWKTQWRQWNETLQNQKFRTGVLFLVMMIAAVCEGLGFSLILPLLNSAIGVQPSTDRASKILSDLVNTLPGGSELVRICCVLMILFILKNVLAVLHKAMAAHFSCKLREVWADQIFKSLLKGAYAQVLGQKQGFLINNATSEPQLAARSVRALLELLSRAFIAFCLYWVLLSAHWKTTLTMTVVGLLLVGFGKRKMDPLVTAIGKQRIRINQNTSAIVTEGVGAIRQIKTFGLEDKFSSRLLEKLMTYTGNETRYTFLTQLPLNVGEVVIVIGFCSFLIYIDLLTSVELKAVIPVLGLFLVVARKMFSDFSLMMSLWMQFLSFSPSLKLVHGLIHHLPPHEKMEEGRKISSLSQGIEFQNVSFEYTPQKPVFKDLSLTLPVKQMIAIVGPSGSGKSTLADLLLRLYEPTAGRILVDGEDLKSFSLSSWRERLGYVSQDTYLLHATIRENILIGRPDASPEEVMESARKANAHSFIMELPEGYETVVGDRGLKLSGGQRQRIAIARVVLRNPELFLFDEATSALDSESERLIQQSIETLSREKTVLVIAHRLSTIQNVDRIYRIRADQTLEEVSYGDLIRTEEKS